MENLQAIHGIQLHPGMVAHAIKEHILTGIMRTRLSHGQYVSRLQGEVIDATNPNNERQVLATLEDGRCLYMRPITRQQIRETMAGMNPVPISLLGHLAVKEEVSSQLTAEIQGEGYDQYLMLNEDVRTMAFETKVDICAHGRLIEACTRQAVPLNVVPVVVHDSAGNSEGEGAPAATNGHGDADQSSVPETQQRPDVAEAEERGAEERNGGVGER